jgi:D-3-phosphoglycerate dehydrogenase / 2-oxoglutarate reductase
MQILFADKFPSTWMEHLQRGDHVIRYEPDLSGTDLAQAVGDAEVLVVRSTKVDANVLEGASSLRLVIRAGAGTNTIDASRASELGIAVCNTPGKNAVAVAELAMGLIIAIDRRIPDNVTDLRSGSWNKTEYSRAGGLYGATLCILGIGAIGLELMARAHAFGMRLVVIDRPGRDSATEDRLARMAVERVSNLQELAAAADFLSVHLPASPDVVGIINAEVLDVMKPGAVIINTSRGELVDEAALITAMNQKGLRAGLDVYAQEPGSPQARFDSPLASHPNVYGTHHIGASTEQAQDAVAEGVVEVINAFSRGTPINCVNQVA